MTLAQHAPHSQPLPSAAPAAAGCISLGAPQPDHGDAAAAGMHLDLALSDGRRLRLSSRPATADGLALEACLEVVPADRAATCEVLLVTTSPPAVLEALRVAWACGMRPENTGPVEARIHLHPRLAHEAWFVPWMDAFEAAFHMCEAVGLQVSLSCELVLGSGAHQPENQTWASLRRLVQSPLLYRHPCLSAALAPGCCSACPPDRHLVRTVSAVVQTIAPHVTLSACRLLVDQE